MENCNDVFLEMPMICLIEDETRKELYAILAFVIEA